MSTTELPLIFKQGLEATKVSYHNLGSSGLRVSVPILGAMSFGDGRLNKWIIDDEEEVLALLKGAYDRGLNTWDTANVYSHGASETLIGKAIKKFNIPRHKVLILTKCYGMVGEQPELDTNGNQDLIADHKDYVNQFGLSRAAIFNAVDASLKRLQLDYIDLLQIHVNHGPTLSEKVWSDADGLLQRYDTKTPLEETMKALDDLVQSGKVRYIGASSMWACTYLPPPKEL
jgi:aryl-alcohol dehydrogenase-like predicted oxidoreductase